MRLHRVFPWRRDVAEGEPGHPLFVPRPQRTGRLDDPGEYLVLYLSDHPAGAVAEAFGNLSPWTEAMFRTRSLAGSVSAFATYEFDGPVLDLDDPRALLERGLRPSHVVTRDRETTQRWALDIFRERRFAGARWWSYYDPRWGSFGIWERTSLRVVGEPVPLARDHPAVVEAGDVLLRTWRS